MVSRRYLAVLLAVALVSAAAVVVVTLPGLNSVTPTTSSSIKLPAGCVKPANGFLIVASQLGFNDSVDHGVPQKSWPVMNVRQGQNVTIVVCNADPSQPHGFQIANYYDPTEARFASVAPDHVLTVNFVADKTGTFRIYCSILCSVHWAMLSGLLIVR
jgi:FtsP/CotA-like multicopper oxidase with cupredoxin domain